MYKDGVLCSCNFFKHGKCHRDDNKPAHIIYNIGDKSIAWEVFYINGSKTSIGLNHSAIRHNKDGTKDYIFCNYTEHEVFMSSVEFLDYKDFYLLPNKDYNDFILNSKSKNRLISDYCKEMING